MKWKEDTLIEGKGDEAVEIVQITPYYSPSIGGISTFVSGLVRHLDNNANVQVISQEGKAKERVVITRVGKGRFILRALRLLRKTDPDVIHCHSHWHMLVPAVLYKRFNKNVRVFFTFHTEPQNAMKKTKRRAFGRLLSQCDAVTYVSKDLKRRIAGRFSIQTRQEVIYPGVEVDLPDEDQLDVFAKKFNPEGRNPVLVFVGLFEWEKKVQGIKILMSSLNLLRDKYPRVKLLIVGDGSRRYELEKTCKDLNISEETTITGLVENVFLPLSLCDIYVHISLQEGLPQSLLEAMILGKPVIASEVGGIPEVVNHGENGILVEPRPETIATSIETLLENPDLAHTLGENARESIRSGFSWNKTANDFLKLYSMD